MSARGLLAWVRRRSAALAVVLLAALAYVPSLASAPGRMPADTKLYLYLEPGALVGRAASTFERDQFAGWVPHQQITYLWPSGPWYWLFDTIGVPDWIAHRLWIGTIMFAAGAGAWWMARRLGLALGGALVVGLVYQLSPYVLPYVSRTSLMLLPWAALGWLVGLAVLATRDERPAGAGSGRRSPGLRSMVAAWRYPALIALVVATVGSVNATALALIAPGPVLWFVHAGWTRQLAWRRVLAIVARTALLCVVVSSWWLAMLVVQSRHGAPVLAYSETLADVSRNSTGSEVLRSLGYWLFYVRDPVAPATTASGDYLVSTRGIVISYAVTLVGLVGLVVARWPARRFAALLALVGVVLAVGVHPVDAPSPLMSLLATDDGSGLALALRSSTRALPLFVLALGLGAGALVAMAPSRRPLRTHRTGRAGRTGRTWSPRVVAAAAVGLLALVNLPALWGHDLVDPAIDRDEQVPESWRAAAESLGDGRDFRVLQLPGAEFGAFRWGYTVDQPLVALTDRPLVTRDLLPLGSAPAMDLLYALDDRAQEGTFELSSVPVVARLLGADTIWLANDLQFERFRTPRPEPFAALFAAPPGDGTIDGLGAVRSFGDPVVNTPDVPMHDPADLADPLVGTALAPVGLVAVDDPVGVVRAKPTAVVLSGSGDGVVDAAAAGLLDGTEAIRYSASLEGAALDDAAAAAAAVLITDSNRDRAHHWRGSQDVHGHTEPGGPGSDVLDRTNADRRLEVFPGDDAARQTIAVQDGPVRAVASSYGEPYAYRPEDRAVMAIDGDPTSAWLVGDHGDPVGQRIALTISGATDGLTLRQHEPAPGGRTISRVALHLDDGSTTEVELTAESLDPAGQAVPLPAGATPGTVVVEVLAVTEGDPTLAASRGAVGFTEIDAGLGPTTEYIRPPVDALDAARGRPLALVLSRLRVDPLDPWRSDPEPELIREISVPDARSLQPDVTLRLDARAADGLLAALLAAPSGPSFATASVRLTGAPRHAGMFAVDGDVTTSWITPFDGAVGATLTIPSAGQVEGTIDIVQPPGLFSTITEVEVGDATTSVVLPVPTPDAAGRSTLALPAPLAGDELRLTITGIEPTTTIDRRYGDVMTLPAAIAEVSGTGIVPVPVDDAGDVTAECRTDLLTIDGEPLPVSFTTTVGALLDGEPVAAEPCGGPVALAAGTHRIRSAARAGGLTVDRVVLADAELPAGTGTIPVTVDVDDARHREVTVAPCPDGCWLVLGEGYNDAWSATTDGGSLGPPQLLDGGFNGWWLEPSTAPTTVELRWTAQRPVTIGLAISIAGIVFCLMVVVATGRRARRVRAVRAVRAVPRPAWLEEPSPAPRWFQPLALLVLGTLLISPWWGLLGGAVGVAAALVEPLLAGRLRPRGIRSVDLVGWFGVLLAAVVALLVVWINRADRPVPNSGWTESFDQLNGPALLAVLCVTVGAFGPARRRRERGGT